MTARRGLLVLALVVVLVTAVQGAGATPVRATGNAVASTVNPTQVVERNWVRVGGPQPPAGPIAYDSLRHQTVLFSANGGGSETWVFDGGTRTWTKKSPATSPALNVGVIMAFDGARGVVVLFGTPEGVDACNPSVVGQTWTWNGTDWSQRHPAHAPDGCFHGTAAYDASRRVVMFYGGDQFEVGEGWTWDGTDWTPITPGPSYAYTALAYDARTSRVLAFGGAFFFHGWLLNGTTMAWDGTRWTVLAAGGGPRDPRPRSSATMFYDPVVGAPVLFGGASNTNGSDWFWLRDTWWWTGTHWVRMGTRSSPPGGAAESAYDTDHGFAVARVAGQTWLFTAAPAGKGAFLTTGHGAVYPTGDAHLFGDARGIALSAPIVGIARTVTRNGYWLVGSDGSVFTFGDARFSGGLHGLPLSRPIIGIAATPSGGGYWLVARDGGVFTFGDARFAGSTGNIRLNKPIVGMAPTPTGDGYWLVASDGGIFAFGDARYYGSTGNLTLNQPVVGMTPTPRGNGYWLVARDGGVFTFGAARFHGAAPGPIPVVAIASTATGNGYWAFTATGQVRGFGDAVPYPGAPSGTNGIVDAAAT